jgi:Fe-S oxidoreductase
MAMDDPGFEAYQFGGWPVAEALRAAGLDQGALAAVRHGTWWVHGVLAITLVAAIPYTKAGHMLTGLASLVARDSDAGKRLRPIPAQHAHEPAGYATRADFSALHLLQLDACTECGRCHEACPATASGLPLSPRDLVLDLRDGRGVGADTLWSCMQCNACVEVCPVGIEQAPIINQLRRRSVEAGPLDEGLQATLQVIHRTGNSFGESRRRRGRWTRDLDFAVKDARTEPVELLWFVGDYASFDPRSQAVSRALAVLLERAGVDFGILYDGEGNAGNDVRRVGEEGLFEALADHNREQLEASRFERIVTTDPHSLNTLRREYGDAAAGWEVIHHTQLLLELLEAGRLPVVRPLSYAVTYHDPCHLGRFNGEYDAPRALLEAIGCSLSEMPRNRDNSFCCGAGGGRIWMADPAPVERPSESRIHEALGLGDLDYFVVACPKDVTMYEDAIRTTGSGGRIALRELTELVAEAAT